MFPVLKKRLCSFLVSEEGRIPDHSLVSLGSLLVTSALASEMVSADDGSGGACPGGDCACAGGSGGEGTGDTGTDIGGGGGGGDCTGGPSAPCTFTEGHYNFLDTPVYASGQVTATHTHHAYYPPPPCSDCGAP